MKHIKRILRGCMRLAFIGIFFAITAGLFVVLGLFVDALYVWTKENPNNSLFAFVILCAAILLVVAWSIGEDRQD